MTAFRNDLDALTARRDTLESETARNLRELADTRTLIDAYTARAKLPVLDNIKVAAPCSADWNKMSGDDRARACGDCNKHVYNLSGMTRDEAEALIVEKEGKLCVRYFQRTDGTILLKDCSIGIKRRRRTRILAGAAVLLAATGAYGANQNRLALKTVVDDHVEYMPMMGMMVAAPQPVEVTQPPSTPEVDPIREIKGQL